MSPLPTAARPDGEPKNPTLTSTEPFRRYLTYAEEKRLFDTVRQYRSVQARRDYAWMLLMRKTGIRVQAFSRITVGDVQQALRTGWLDLPAKNQKRKQAHSVKLVKEAQDAVRLLLRVRREMGYAEIPAEPLVISRNYEQQRRKGKPYGMSVRSYQARMQYWRELAGLKEEVSPHWLRHTLGKRLWQQSIAQDRLSLIRKVLGHASIASTTVYAEPDKEDVSAFMEDAA